MTIPNKKQPHLSLFLLRSADFFHDFLFTFLGALVGFFLRMAFEGMMLFFGS